MAHRKEHDGRRAESLNELERVLASFPLRESGASAAELMYQAGWAAACADREQGAGRGAAMQRGFGWTRATTIAASLAGASAVAAAVLLALLVNRPVRVVEKTNQSPGADVVRVEVRAPERDGGERAADAHSIGGSDWPQLRTARDRQLAMALADSARFAGASSGAGAGESSAYFILQQRWLRSDSREALP